MIVGLSTFWWLQACQEALPKDPAIAFQALIEKNVFPRSLPPGLTVHVEAPKHQISWTGAAGVSQTGTDKKVQINQPYRVASITKTFVATSILLLQEQGLLSIDDPISQHISAEHTTLLQQGGYQADRITIRHCLNHTSGLFDYARSEQYEEIARADTSRVWTRTAQLEGAITWGSPLGIPDTAYHYSDTGYILLGEIIERLTQKNLGQAVRDLIDYERLGMITTWWENLEPTPPNMLPQVSRYAGRKEITNYDASIDLYGGGGIVSTSSDLGLFIHHLFNHRIFRDKATLDLMLSKSTFPIGYQPDKDYRLGLYKVSLYGMDVYMHSGVWGTQMMYIPTYDAAVVVNHTNWGQYYVIKQVVSLLKNYVEK